jgi:hypothetical protein
MNNFEEKTKNQGTRKPEASQKENGDMAWACCEELVELDDVQLATVVGGGPKPKPPGKKLLGLNQGNQNWEKNRASWIELMGRYFDSMHGYP